MLNSALQTSGFREVLRRNRVFKLALQRIKNLPLRLGLVDDGEPVRPVVVGFVGFVCVVSSATQTLRVDGPVRYVRQALP